MNRQQQRARIAQLITDLHFEEQIGDEDAAFLRSLAEEAQAEPVAEVDTVDLFPDHQGPVEAFRFLPVGTMLYTHPPAKQEPLTEEQINAELSDVAGGYVDMQSQQLSFARAIEAACAKKWGVKL